MLGLWGIWSLYCLISRLVANLCPVKDTVLVILLSFQSLFIHHSMVSLFLIHLSLALSMSRQFAVCFYFHNLSLLSTSLPFFPSANPPKPSVLFPPIHLVTFIPLLVDKHRL